MNFGDIQNRLFKRILRNDLLADGSYGVFINEALREIQNRRSWSFMKNTLTLVIPQGQTSVNLPSNVKELQNLRPPVHVVLTDPALDVPVLKPVDVVYQLQETNRVWNFGGLVWTVRIVLDQASDTKTLSIIVPAGEDLTFQVKVFQYLPDLSGGTDTSLFIDKYPEMVFSKAKANAFADINDWIAEEKATAHFELKFLAAAKQDAFSNVSGLANRM